MKYMITWNERPQGSAIEYEKAQQRILDVFRKWEKPDNFNIEMFVIRVGDWKGAGNADADVGSIIANRHARDTSVAEELNHRRIEEY